MTTNNKKRTTKQRIDQLEKKIARRLKFLALVVDDSERIIFNLGKETEHTQGDSHTHTKSEYIGSDFEIFGDFGQSMFGGNVIKIKYQGKLVFEAYWQTFAFNEKDGEVKLFDQGNWRDKLRSLARRAKKKKESKVQVIISKFDENVHLKELQLQAEKLGVPNP